MDSLPTLSPKIAQASCEAIFHTMIPTGSMPHMSVGIMGIHLGNAPPIEPAKIFEVCN